MSALSRVECIREAGLAPCFLLADGAHSAAGPHSLSNSFAGPEAWATAIKPPAGPELDVQLSGQKSLKEHER